MVDYTKRATPPPPPAQSSTGGTGGGTGAPVSLSKVTLTKSSPTVSLTKAAGAGGHLRVSLTWSAAPPSAPGGGFFKKMLRPAGGIDLDLGCLWELTDGRKGVVQALGNAFGALDRPPYVLLDGDDRTGGGGETMTVNLAHLAEIRRILVFAYIYEGVPAWDKADGVVTLYPQGSAPIEILLDEGSGARMCALALLESDGYGLVVKREVRYVDGTQSALDRAYGWGMDWTPGRK